MKNYKEFKVWQTSIEVVKQLHSDDNSQLSSRNRKNLERYLQMTRAVCINS